MVWKRIQAERQRGRDYQPRFQQRHVIGAWIGALLAITALGLISLWSHYPWSWLPSEPGRCCSSATPRAP